MVVYHPFPQHHMGPDSLSTTRIVTLCTNQFRTVYRKPGQHNFSQAGFHQLCWLGDGICHLSNVQNPVDIPLYWLVDRDPYNGLL